ncbi:MAG TPA: hypothetical protein VLD64_02275 [Nitrosarchaeum sp.]|nr:hypothetical protein [Nitrosarchaeum sp.]
MEPSDILTMIMSGAVAFATFLLWRATKQLSVTTKEIGKLTIMPKITIVNHNKVGDDEIHEHFEFSLKNDGVGNAFEIQIETFHKGGSTVHPTIHMIGVNAADRVTDNSVDKSDKTVRYKISYRDIADNSYTRHLLYDLEDHTTKILKIIKF